MVVTVMVMVMVREGGREGGGVEGRGCTMGSPAHSHSVRDAWVVLLH